MKTPDTAPAVEPETLFRMAAEGAFEGLPPLPNERMPDDFNGGAYVLDLFYRTWMEEGPQLVPSRIDDVWRTTRPLALRLPLGVDFQDITREVAAESDGQLDEVALRREVNPEPLRQHLLRDPELRPYLPSPGFVNLETPKTDANRTGSVIGVNMNNIALIPRAAIPHLIENPDYREAWLVNGSVTWDGEAEALREKLSELRAESDVNWQILEGADMVAGAEAAATAAAAGSKRARPHATLQSGKVGNFKVGRHRPTFSEA